MFNVDYSDFKGKTVVFYGENASTGEPHPITGNMSFWGEFAVFDCKNDAIEFVDKIERNNPTGKTDIGTAGTMRKYSLGCSVRDYLNYLYHNYYCGD